MIRKVTLAAAAGSVLTAAVAWLLLQADVRGQDKAGRTLWEHKVVYCYSQGADPNQAAQAMTLQYSSLANEGWEYVGPVVDRTAARALNNNYSGTDGVFVLFKRPRQ